MGRHRGGRGRVGLRERRRCACGVEGPARRAAPQPPAPGFLASLFSYALPLRSALRAQGACRAGLSCGRWWRMASPSPGPRCREGVALAALTRTGAGAAAEGSTRGSIVLRMATRVDRGRRREGRRRRRRLGRGRRRAGRRRSDRSAKMSRSRPRERRRARQLRPTGPRIPLRKVTREAGSELLAGGSMSLGKIDLRVVRFTASL